MTNSPNNKDTELKKTISSTESEAEIISDDSGLENIISENTSPEDITHKNLSPENDTEGEITLEEITRDEMRELGKDKRIKSVSASGKIRYRKVHKHHHKKHHNHKRHHTPKKFRILKRVLLGILIFLLVAAAGIFAAYKISNYLGKKAFLQNNENASIQTIDGAGSEDDGQIITYKGEKYRFNKNLISIVFLGIDKSELGADVVGKGGQADAVYIFTYNTKNGECSMIPVSRETMTEVRLYSTSGKEMGLEKMQLCLAYGYGDGKESSCNNTLESLSRIFYNIPFLSYVSLNWDGIGPLNDAIGGVTLTALEDVSTTRSVISKGDKVTLVGDDAWSYVKYRDTTKLKSNSARLSRQKQYLKAYASKLIPMAKRNFTVVTDLIDTANDYMYSNLTTTQMVYIASEILPNVYSSGDIHFVTIDGKTKQGETYAEFYPDETALYETILDIFYEKESK